MKKDVSILTMIVVQKSLSIYLFCYVQFMSLIMINNDSFLQYLITWFWIIGLLNPHQIKQNAPSTLITRPLTSTVALSWQVEETVSGLQAA